MKHESSRSVIPPGGVIADGKVTCHPQALMQSLYPISWTEQDEETGDALFESGKYPGFAYRLHRLTQEKVVITFEGSVQKESDQNF